MGKKQRALQALLCTIAFVLGGSWLGARMQSRAEVVSLTRGEAVIFPVHHRPVQGSRGTYRVNMRHGVSRVQSGRRHTLGIIFHDAK